MAEPSQQFHVTGAGVDVHMAAHGEATAPPTILVPGLAAGPAGFTMHPRRSVADMVRDIGRTPWLVDFDASWRSRGQGARVLFKALALALAELCGRTGYEQSEVDAIGHSLGGILLLGLLADGVPIRRVVTLASAVDYRSARSPLTTALSRLPGGLGPLRSVVGRGGLPVRRLAEVAAPVYGRGLPLPVQSDQFHPGTTPGPLQRSYLREASRDLPLPLLIDLAELYTERGLHLAGDRPLREAVAEIATPVLLVAARQDRQCPLQSVRDAARLIPGAALHEVGRDGVAEGYGHVDVLLGRHAPEEVLVPVERFLRGAPLARAVGT